MSDTFAHLFSPLALRHLRLKNRITFGAHTANMSEDGLPGARHLGYYLARARGGCGMIVVEPSRCTRPRCSRAATSATRATRSSRRFEGSPMRATSTARQ